MSIILYGRPGTAAQAPHAVLEELGLPYESVEVTVDGERIAPADYPKLNPHRRVPTVVHDGHVVYESAACCLYLAELVPAAGLVPQVGTPARGDLYRWMMYLTNTLQATLMLHFYPSDATDDPAGEAGILRHVDAKTAAMYRFIDGELADGREWLVGGAFSVADIYLWMLTAWDETGSPLATELKHLGAHYRRVSARPACRRVLDLHGYPVPAAG